MVLPVYKSNGYDKIDSFKECYMLLENGKKIDEENFMIKDIDEEKTIIIVPSFMASIFVSYKMDKENKNEVETKLFFPVLFFYVLHFFMMLSISVIVCIFCSNICLRIQFIRNTILTTSLSVIAKMIKMVILSTPFLLVLCLLNKVSTYNENSFLFSFIQNMFVRTILFYIFLCLILMLYILPGIIDDCHNYYRKIINSEEIAYKETIGMDPVTIRHSINFMYGRPKKKQIIVEAWLFLFTLLFYVFFCLNTPLFGEFPEVTQILSFENIFTKLFWVENGLSPMLLVHGMLYAMVYVIILITIHRLSR
jgi:hypothetical protein